MKVVSLFAGCGGLDLGFEKAGVNVVWANEYDESIHKTYRLNHPNTTLNTSDIRTLSGADIPDCDGIIGGPPCQTWSEGGKRLGLKDSRGQLFLDYIRIVREKQPKFFLIENVQGILDDEHKYMSRNRVRSWNEPSFTIQAQARNVPQHPQVPKMAYVTSNLRSFAKGYEHLYRRLSVRE